MGETDLATSGDRSDDHPYGGYRTTAAYSAFWETAASGTVDATQTLEMLIRPAEHCDVDTLTVRDANSAEDCRLNVGPRSI